MVYLDAYNPRDRHLMGAYHPRRRYLSLGAYHPRRRYLSGCGCGSFTCICKRWSGLMNQPGVQRMIGPLGDDIAPPAISAGAPGSTPTLFSDLPASAPAPPPGSVYGPVMPGQTINPAAANAAISPQAPVLPASALAMPVAPAIGYGAPASMAPVFAITGAGASSPPGTFLGIPTQYFVYGGLGLVALSVLGGMKKGGGRRR